MNYIKFKYYLKHNNHKLEPHTLYDFINILLLRELISKIKLPGRNKSYYTVIKEIK